MPWCPLQDDEEEQGTVNQLAYRLYTMDEFLAAKRDPIVAQQEKGAVIPDMEPRMSLCATAEGASRSVIIRGGSSIVVDETVFEQKLYANQSWSQ